MGKDKHTYVIGKGRKTILTTSMSAMLCHKEKKKIYVKTLHCNIFTYKIYRLK